MKGILQSFTGGLQKKLDSSAEFYRIDQHHSRTGCEMRQNKRLTRIS